MIYQLFLIGTSKNTSKQVVNRKFNENICSFLLFFHPFSMGNQRCQKYLRGSIHYKMSFLRVKCFFVIEKHPSKQAEKIEKIEIFFSRFWAPEGQPHRGPVFWVRGRTSGNASMSLIILLCGSCIPIFMAIGPVLFSEPILGQEIGSLPLK